MRLPSAIFAFYVLAAFSDGGLAHADIIWHRPDEPIKMQTLTGKSFNFDADFNGAADLTFRSNGATFWLEQLGESAILGHGLQPPDAGVDVANLGSDYLIDSSPTDGLSWSMSPDSGVFSSCMTTGCIGIWLYPNDKGYFGIRIQIKGEAHYGWVYLDNTFAGLGGGDIVEWAYESRPGVAIVSGMVPEPSTVGLFALGAAILRNSKKKLLTTGCCGRNTAADP